MTNSPDFKDESLTEFSHIDPDKHWIGETLPAPSNAETSAAGGSNSAGTSPYPARADHSHDYRTIKGFYAMSAAKTCGANAATYIDGISLLGGDQMLRPGSSQLFEFPKEGVWDISLRFTITRSTGLFPNLMFYSLRAYYYNSTLARSINVLPTNEGRTVLTNTATDVAYFGAPVDATTNVQFWINNLDTVDWLFQFGTLEITRRCSIEAVSA